MDEQESEGSAPMREIGQNAVWSLSSCKQGFGVHQLRDGSEGTYWQSDGPQPHLVNIQFHKKTTVCELRIFASIKQDESYTPNKLSVRVGTNFHDMREIDVIELNDPEGWIIIPLLDAEERPLRTHLVQLAILSNHQNGRDTHLRLADIFSPLERPGSHIMPFTTPECAMFNELR